MEYCRGHTFNPKHGLTPLIEQLGGEEQLTRAVFDAANGAFPPSGVFKLQIDVNGYPMFVTGRVMDGFPKISNFWIHQMSQINSIKINLTDYLIELLYNIFNNLNSYPMLYKRILEVANTKNWHEIDSVFSNIEVSNDVNEVVNTIYSIWYLLLETILPVDMMESVILIAKEYFKEAADLYKDDFAFLFFSGFILQVCSYCFGEFEDSDVAEFKKKAITSKSEFVLLAKWSLCYSTGGDNSHPAIANEIIKNHPKAVSWLKTFDFAGEHVLEHLNMCNDRYVNREIKT